MCLLTFHPYVCHVQCNNTASKHRDSVANWSSIWLGLCIYPLFTIHLPTYHPHLHWATQLCTSNNGLSYSSLSTFSNSPFSHQFLFKCVLQHILYQWQETNPTWNSFGHMYSKANCVFWGNCYGKLPTYHLWLCIIKQTYDKKSDASWERRCTVSYNLQKSSF